MRTPLRVAAAWCALAAPLGARAQTDYYNTDSGRPIQVEDAYPTERNSFDLHLAPFRVDRSRGGVYTWGFSPELAYGAFPRTQLELGLPLAYADRSARGGGGRRGGLAGVELTALYNLNAETERVPALGVRAGVLLPVGALAPDRAYPSVKAIATRTTRLARFHANARLTAGPTPNEPPPNADGPNAGRAGAGAHGGTTRWSAGLAADRAFPLRSTLVTGELVAARPLGDGAAVRWEAAAGLRHQLDPRVAVDAGVGRRLTGDDRPWHVTFGLAYVLGVRRLVRVP